MQNDVFVKVGLYSPYPGADVPKSLPPLKEANIEILDADFMAKNREKLMEGWRDIMRG